MQLYKTGWIDLADMPSCPIEGLSHPSCVLMKLLHSGSGTMLCLPSLQVLEDICMSW